MAHTRRRSCEEWRIRRAGKCTVAKSGTGAKIGACAGVVAKSCECLENGGEQVGVASPKVGETVNGGAQKSGVASRKVGKPVAPTVRGDTTSKSVAGATTSQFRDDAGASTDPFAQSF